MQNRYIYIYIYKYSYPRCIASSKWNPYLTKSIVIKVTAFCRIQHCTAGKNHDWFRVSLLWLLPKAWQPPTASSRRLILQWVEGSQFLSDAPLDSAHEVQTGKLHMREWVPLNLEECPNFEQPCRLKHQDTYRIQQRPLQGNYCKNLYSFWHKHVKKRCSGRPLPAFSACYTICTSTSPSFLLMQLATRYMDKWYYMDTQKRPESETSWMKVKQLHPLAHAQLTSLNSMQRLSPKKEIKFAFAHGNADCD